MSYFPPYGHKQLLGKTVQNLRSAEQEQSGKVLVPDLIKAGLPAPGNIKNAAPPYPSRGCSNSDVRICYPNAHFYQWSFLLCISKGLGPPHPFFFFL